MRLLHINSVGDIAITGELLGREIPNYAILSHTWGSDEDEVNFYDLVHGLGRKKPGFEKIRFCSERARSDGIQYFWIDTCCIDRANSTELSEAINSMFAWYRDAARCYALLTDVSNTISTSKESNKVSWRGAFSDCRWFTRGWTLQELIAPKSVEFFSQEGVKLGDKKSLELEIVQITGIPPKALRGEALSAFTVMERMAWVNNRQTRREEDMVYSLLGIFDISMPLIYGEGYRRAHRRLQICISDTVRDMEQQHNSYSIPFSLFNIPGTEGFTGRQEELTKIKDALHSDDSRRIAILYGLGGIGKSQIAATYAKRNREHYSAIFWLNAQSEDSLTQSFAHIASQIHQQHTIIKGSSDPSSTTSTQDAVITVKSWLGLPRNRNWLLIFDNYDNISLSENSSVQTRTIDEYIPQLLQGCIIITTRSSNIMMGRRIKINKLDNIVESMDILSYTSERKDFANDPDAINLAKSLDGLPLALTTAGLYLSQTTLTCSDYIRLYKTSWAKLQLSSPEVTSYEYRTLYSTWEISLSQLKTKYEPSSEFIGLWAYFNNNDIWFELFSHPSIQMPSWLESIVMDEVSFHKAMRILGDHGLTEISVSQTGQHVSNGYGIHGCVHSWIVNVLNQPYKKNLAILAVKLIAATIPKQEETISWVTQYRLFPHAATALSALSKSKVADKEIFNELSLISGLYFTQGRYDEASDLYHRVLDAKVEMLGSMHTSTLDTINSIGAVYHSQGKFDSAEKMFRKALIGKEQVTAKNDLRLLDIIDNLGLVYTYMEKWEKAENMLQRALHEKKCALGPQHFSTLQTLRHLGNLYTRQGKFSQAMNLYNNALEGTEAILGAEHLATLDILYDLGNLLWDQGRLQDTVPIYLKVLQGRQRSLGETHISTLDVLGNLGTLYADLDRLDDAERVFQQALRAFDKLSTTYTTEGLHVLNSLANVYSEQGKFSLAEAMYLRALPGFETTLGYEAEATLDTVYNLALLYDEQDIRDKAETMYQRVLHGQEAILGHTHPTVLTTVYQLGKLYDQHNQHKDAAALYTRILESLLQDNSHLKNKAANGLAYIYYQQGYLDKSEALYREVLGLTHEYNSTPSIVTDDTTINAMINMGNLLAFQRKPEEARNLLERAAAGIEAASGKGSSIHDDIIQKIKKLEVGAAFSTTGTRKKELTLSSSWPSDLTLKFGRKPRGRMKAALRKLFGNF